MYINAPKTKLMVVYGAGTTLERNNALNEYERTDKFVYLRSLIEAGEGSTGEIRGRIALRKWDNNEVTSDLILPTTYPGGLEKDK